MKQDLNIEIFDTTLRDGTQTPGISLSVGDKLKIAQVLDDLGVTYIEGGWPGSNPKDVEFFRLSKRLKLKNAQIVAFGSTRKKFINAKDDTNLLKIVDSGVKVACIFGKTWTLHVKKALETTLEENLNMIFDSITFLRNKKIKVIYDAEHFFDGYKEDKDYSLKCLEQSFLAQADCLVLCDTNGGCLPSEIQKIVQEVNIFFSKKYPSKKIKLGIHAHNDSGCAVANSIVAVEEGCVHVQGTINGLGERCGNANLCSIIPLLELKKNIKILPEGYLKKLTEVSREVDEITNSVPNERQPFVGMNAFAHKGGIHASAVSKITKTYEHINPKLVGNERKILISELAGKSNILFKKYGLSINLNDENIAKIIKVVKQKEYEGYSYENAEGSFIVLVNKIIDSYKQFFKVISFRVITEYSQSKQLTTEATIRIEINDKEEHVVAEGDGPVNALDTALRKALEKYYPQLKDVKLTDFKVRVINPVLGTAAKVRVNIESMDKKGSWTTVGISENIIEASWEALVDAIEYKLLQSIK